MTKSSIVIARRRVAAGYAQALEEDSRPRNAPKLDGARSAPRLKAPAADAAKAKSAKPAKSKPEGAARAP
jgi:hypothetical protein